MKLPTTNRIARLTVIAFLCSISGAVSAGPVEDRLKFLGSNVPAPTLRTPGVEPAAPAQDDPLENKDVGLQEADTDDAQEAVSDTVELPDLPESDGSGPSISEASCVEELRSIASIDVSDQPIDADDACIIDNPVILKATLGSYPVEYTKGLLLSCPFALRLVRFTTDTVQPLARHHIGTKLTKIGSGQGFVCRRRNSLTSGDKWSEHSFGKAIDVVNFSFDGRKDLPVRTSADMDAARAAFFNATRVAACGTFTTVLGPGSNAAHATHLHFDTGRMIPDKKNPYRICE